VLNELFITPLCSDPRRPSLVTHYAGVVRLRPANLPQLGPLPLKVKNWLPDSLAGERAPLPVPLCWASGGLERDAKDWLADLGDRELSHLLGFLNLKGLAAVASTSRRMRRLAQCDAIWRTVCMRLWREPAVAGLERSALTLGWKRVAREVFTLEALHWRRRRVGGAVHPVRTNFSTCGLGDRVYIFGGEGVDAAAYHDLFVLDLGAAQPCWERVVFPEGAVHPRGRWGHTLRELGGDRLVLFGGSSAEGPVNDVHVLELNAPGGPAWREHHCAPQPQPLPRSWHGACTLNGSELLVFGGCSSGGRLLSDTWLLNLDAQWPVWQELSVGWTPPARLGLSLVATEEGRVFAFGGLASAGPVRLRSQDAFTMDLRSPNPTWHYVTGSQLPSGAAAAGTPPPPRLEQVAGTLIGGRVLVFGGSVNGGSAGGAQTRAWEPYVMSPNSETPTWRRLRVTGTGPRDAWGYSACMLGYQRFVLSGKYDGASLDLNELHELNLLTQPGEEQPDDSRGSNTAYDVVVLAPRLDAGELSDDSGEEAAVEDDDGEGPRADGPPQPGDSLRGDHAQDSGLDEEQSRLQPARAQLRGFGSWSDNDMRSSLSADSTDDLPATGAADQPAEYSLMQPSSAEVVSRREMPGGSKLHAMLFPKLPFMASGARLLTQLRTAVGAVAGAMETAVEEPSGEPAGAGPIAAEAVEDEGMRRRRSLTGRGLGHPRPAASSGSDEEPPTQARKNGQ